MQPFPTPSDATHKMWSRLADWRDIQVRKCKTFVIQGQVTPKWVVWSGPKSNSSELLYLPWLSATLMMIRSKMNELHVAWREHFPIISLWGFFRRSRAANSVVSGPIWPTFELFRDFVHVFLVTCKYKGIGAKTTEIRWRHRFPHYKSMGVMETRVLIQSVPKPYAAFLPIQWCRRESEIFKFERVDDDGRRRTTTRTDDDGRTTDHWYAINSREPSAQVG